MVMLRSGPKVQVRLLRSSPTATPCQRQRHANEASQAEIPMGGEHQGAFVRGRSWSRVHHSTRARCPLSTRRPMPARVSSSWTWPFTLPWGGTGIGPQGEGSRGAVVYIAAEGGNGFANRVAASGSACHPDGAECPLAVVPSAIDLLDPKADLEHILALIGNVRPSEVSVVMIICRYPVESHGRRRRKFVKGHDQLRLPMLDTIKQGERLASSDGDPSCR